jgi:hypothetical protein
LRQLATCARDGGCPEDSNSENDGDDDDRPESAMTPAKAMSAQLDARSPSHGRRPRGMTSRRSAEKREGTRLVGPPVAVRLRPARGTARRVISGAAVAESGHRDVVRSRGVDAMFVGRVPDGQVKLP